MPGAAFLPLPVDPARYTVQDGAGTVRSAVPRWRLVLADLDDVPHAAVVALDGLADALRAAGGVGDTIDDLAGAVNARLVELERRLGAATPLLEALDPADPLVTAVESVDRLLSAAGRSIAVDRVDPGVGRVTSVNLSGGGVPKRPVDRAVVTPSGLEGDGQRVRRHHGRPSQALSMWSTEVIQALAAEGHPVVPGGAGENLTLSGLDWSTLRPGVRLVLGCRPGRAGGGDHRRGPTPCTTIAANFAGRDFRRIDHAPASGVEPGLCRGGRGRRGPSRATASASCPDRAPVPPVGRAAGGSAGVIRGTLEDPQDGVHLLGARDQRPLVHQEGRDAVDVQVAGPLLVGPHLVGEVVRGQDGCRVGGVQPGLAGQPRQRVPVGQIGPLGEVGEEGPLDQVVLPGRLRGRPGDEPVGVEGVHPPGQVEAVLDPLRGPRAR